MERDRLKQAMEMDSSLLSFGGTGNNQLVVNLKSSLASALHQNKELKNRLNKIHENSDLSDVSSIAQSDQVRLEIFCVITNRFFISMLMSFHENIIIISFIGNFLCNNK